MHETTQSMVAALGPVAGEGWVGWVAVGTVVVIVVAAAAGLAAMARRKSTTERAYFRLYPTQELLWGEPKPVRIDVSHLLGGLGLHGAGEAVDCFVADVPWGFPADMPRGLAATERSTVVSIPFDATSRLPFAAAGCGVRATPIPQPEQWVATGQFTPLPRTLEVHPNPGWLLGVSPNGHAVRVHAIPGATVVLVAPEAVLPIVRRGLSWPHDAVSFIVATAPGISGSHAAAGTSWLADCREEWAAAWDPGTTRVVVVAQTTPDVSTQVGKTVQDVRENTGILADVVVTVDSTTGQGILSYTDHEEFFALTQHHAAARQI